jgi:myo-inositol 2-dehydrogenase/D-chiro-inositol 1-dehydrogenase
MIATGQEVSAEGIGTEGKLTMNLQTMSNLGKYHQPGEVRREMPQSYYGRSKERSVIEANEFTV